MNTKNMKLKKREQKQSLEDTMNDANLADQRATLLFVTLALVVLSNLIVGLSTLYGINVLTENYNTMPSFVETGKVVAVGVLWATVIHITTLILFVKFSNAINRIGETMELD